MCNSGAIKSVVFIARLFFPSWCFSSAFFVFTNAPDRIFPFPPLALVCDWRQLSFSLSYNGLCDTQHITESEMRFSSTSQCWVFTPPLPLPLLLGSVTTGHKVTKIPHLHWWCLRWLVECQGFPQGTWIEGKQTDGQTGSSEAVVEF